MGSTRGPLRWCCVGLALLAWAVPVRAAEYYVSSQRGDDSRGVAVARQPKTPWATLARAAEAVEAGDTVFVQAGHYTAGAVVKAKGTAQKPILFKAIGDVVIRHTRELPMPIPATKGMKGVYGLPDPGPVACVFQHSAGPRVLVELFGSARKRKELLEAKNWSRLFHDAKAKMLYLKPRQMPMVKGDQKLLASRIQTALQADGEFITFEGFRVAFAVQAVSLNGKHNTARGIRAYQCGGGGTVAGLSNTMEFCVVEICQSGISATGSDCTVRNNTVYGTRAFGLGTSPHTTGTIINNIFWAGGVSGGCCFLGMSSDADVTMDHNVWLKYTNRRGRLSIYKSADKSYITSLIEFRKLGFGQHSLQIEPGLVSVQWGELDLRLRTRAAGYVFDSPCINAGTPAGTDIGALQVPTPVPQQVTARKASEGVTLRWSLPWRADTMIDGFRVQRRRYKGVRGELGPFGTIATLRDPGVREFIDKAGSDAYQYRVISFRPGKRIESKPSATVATQ